MTTLANISNPVAVNIPRVIVRYREPYETVWHVRGGLKISRHVFAPRDGDRFHITAKRIIGESRFNPGERLTVDVRVGRAATLRKALELVGTLGREGVTL